MIVSESSTADTREVKSRYVPGPIDKLRAIEEIRQLKSRYFQVVDEKDWAGIEALFTTDARVDFGGEGQHHIGHHGVTAADINPDDWIVSGGEATARVIAGAVSEVISVHQGHDPQIELISRIALWGAGRCTTVWSTATRSCTATVTTTRSMSAWTGNGSSPRLP